jgi:Pregnancy-associated plasma protein-A/Secretion system C-terminal sorting domain
MPGAEKSHFFSPGTAICQEKQQFPRQKDNFSRFRAYYPVACSVRKIIFVQIPLPMSKRALQLFVLLFLNLSLLQAQAPCAFDIRHNRLLNTDPGYARQMEQNDQTIQRIINAHPEWLQPGTGRLTAAYTIPVVVHVMHTGGAVGTIYNPTDAQITGAIDYLNQVFAGTYPGMTSPVEGGGVVDMEVQFALAQRTPSCGSTNGIDRVDASGLANYTANGINVNNATGCPELTMKNLARWTTSNYYNIWLVNKIDGADGTSGQFIAGFAYFPGAPSTLDGTVMLATQMVAGEKTLPHEIGHALNLYHPFQGSADNTQCPVNSNCTTDGDRICDTDPIFNNLNSISGIYSFACRTGANICAAPNNYTINTESNFMSYTNCYTLFTNGQKARAQAAMLLPSRTSLVDPSNLALVPCGTTINFSLATSSRSESTSGTLSGCRTYTDYTYQMTIGAAPTATATATMTYSGTGTKGLDYEVTTNGNFSSPSDVLTFTSGSTSAQNFTIRIYDDANVESAETIILDFTVNNGGGDATKGVTTPTLTVTVADNDLIPAGSSSGTYSLGTVGYNYGGGPFDARQQSQRSQLLYRANELTAAGGTAGSINSLQLFINTKSSTRPYTNFSIKMGQTSTVNLVDGGVTVISGMTTVYTSASFSTIAGWNLFTLSTPFAWDGSSNLAIEICYDNITADAGNAADGIGCYADGGSATQGNFFFQNGINCSGSFSSVSYLNNGIKPVIRMAVSATGTSIETTTGATAANHITVGSNDYFYSNNSKLLFRIGSVNASLGCVNASLEAGGTTWISALGGERSAKVFAITPTTNTTTTDYTIALYFENAELGGKNANTLRIAKTTAASAAAANSSNTVLITPTVSTLGSGTTVFTGNFTGFSRFFLVDAGVVLPVTLTSFTGTAINKKQSLLRWTTSFEQNNKHFTVEVSRDGIRFSPLATIASKGNSSSDQQYEYLHERPATGMNWYRLVQTDLDNQSKFSQVISVLIGNGQNEAYLFPVPARDQLSIVFNSAVNNTRIEILAADMRILKYETVSNLTNRKDISVSGLPAGIYFVRISGTAGNQLLRFIKE